jgi:ABC-type phosphate transport system substrate-binding protein
MKNLSKYLRGTVFASTVLFCALAQADVVVVMAAGSSALTKDQVAAIYLGRSTDLKPVDQPEGTPIRDEFYKKATDRDAAQVKAVWSRIVFTGKGQPPKEAADAAAVKKAVAADPKAVGYVDKAAVDGSVKVVLSLD